MTDLVQGPKHTFEVTWGVTKGYLLTVNGNYLTKWWRRSSIISNCRDEF